MGNGAKAQQKRERNADKNRKGPKSQSKVNEAAKSTIVCSTCKQSFMCTTRAPALEEHASNKHDKKLAECFPDFQQQLENRK